MSYPSSIDDQAFTLAPHQLHNSVYNAQGTCSGFLIPPNDVPIEQSGAIPPVVDCQAAEYWATPRVQVGLGGSMGIYSGYRETASLQPAIPAAFPISRPVQAVQVDYYGCPTPMPNPGVVVVEK